MIIVNADDWGRSRTETDAALACFEAGRITSVTAMVFMEDSGRAAELAKHAGVDVGLHLNLSQPFTGACADKLLQEYHDRIVRFLTWNKYSMFVYHPALRAQFHYVYRTQVEEFRRLYGKQPSHIDGHHHKHLCLNMLMDKVIPCGELVRRNFSFLPGEKGLVNRTYRRVIDQWLARRYRMTDFFFSIVQCLQSGRLQRVAELSTRAAVEIMVHPVNAMEYHYVMSDDYRETVGKAHTGSYSSLHRG